MPQKSTAGDFAQLFNIIGDMEAISAAGGPEEDEQYEAAVDTATILHHITAAGVESELATGRHIKVSGRKGCLRIVL